MPRCTGCQRRHRLGVFAHRRRGRCRSRSRSHPDRRGGRSVSRRNVRGRGRISFGQFAIRHGTHRYIPGEAGPDRYAAEEEAELASIYESRGLSAVTAALVAREMTEKDALGAHVRDELGLSDVPCGKPTPGGLCVWPDVHGRRRPAVARCRLGAPAGTTIPAQGSVP